MFAAAQAAQKKHEWLTDTLAAFAAAQAAQKTKQAR